MNMKLVEHTLFIHMNGEDEILRIKERTFGFLNEYDIHNIVLHIISNDFCDSRKLDAFIRSFPKNGANLILK